MRIQAVEIFRVLDLESKDVLCYHIYWLLFCLFLGPMILYPSVFQLHQDVSKGQVKMFLTSLKDIFKDGSKMIDDAVKKILG